tara:strand:+ start:1065 stop:2204 length:1140 start_codon:yes stop_codon:yes gene_type:complete
MKKKICFVVSSPFTAQVFLKNHIQELAVFYDIFLVANFSSGDKKQFKELKLKEIKHIPISRKIDLVKDIKALFLFWNYFNLMKFDAVHTVTPKAGLLGVFAARLANTNNRIHIFTGQIWHTKTGLFRQLLKIIDKFIVWNATDILVDGETQRQFLIKNKIIPLAHSFVLGKGSISGVNTKRFVPDIQVKNKVRDELGIKVNEIVYTFLGRMNTDKGIIELAEAFNALQIKYLNVRLLILGADEENIKSIIQQKIKDIKSVIFYGLTLCPEKTLQASDVYCMPSYREGFGTSIIEASSLEKPIICSDTYGLMETIIENKTGLRHKVADVTSLYIAMEKLVEDKNLREKLGKLGRAYVLENFSAKIITDKWLEFYASKFHV